LLPFDIIRPYEAYVVTIRTGWLRLNEWMK